MRSPNLYRLYFVYWILVVLMSFSLVVPVLIRWYQQGSMQQPDVIALIGGWGITIFGLIFLIVFVMVLGGPPRWRRW